jgi:hypothetical protein
MIDTIPNCPVTKKKMREHEETMVAGNVVLKRLHGRIKERAGGKKYSRAKFRRDVFNIQRQEDGRIKVFGLLVPKCDLDKIHAVKNIEWDVICAFSRLVHQLAERWSRRSSDLTVSYADLYDEASFSLFHAVYYYTGFTKKNKRVSFCTYCYHAINNRLITVCSRTRSTSPLSHDAVELFDQYQVAKRGMNRPANFDEIVECMGIGPDQRNTLEAMLISVFHQGVMETRIVSRTGESGNDFSKLGLKFAGMDGSVAWRVTGHSGRYGTTFQTTEPDFDLKRAVTDVNLSELEQAVLIEFLTNPKSGWMSRVAENINPKTGKPYSRMAITLAWRRAKQKILDAYSNEAA